MISFSSGFFFSFLRFFLVQSLVCKQLDIPVHRNIRNTVFKTFHDSVLRRFNLTYLVLCEIIIFQPSDRSGIHFIVVPIRGWLHGLPRRLFSFTKHSVNYGRKKLCFHFRSSSKSTYFPNRKILIQNSYLASGKMGSTPWTK